MTGGGRHDLVGTSGRVGALAPARHARRVRLTDKVFFLPEIGGLFSAVRSKTLKKNKKKAVVVMVGIPTPARASVII